MRASHLRLVGPDEKPMRAIRVVAAKAPLSYDDIDEFTASTGVLRAAGKAVGELHEAIADRDLSALNEAYRRLASAGELARLGYQRMEGRP